MLRRVAVCAVIGSVLMTVMIVADLAPRATPAGAQLGFGISRYFGGNEYQTVWAIGLLGGGGAYGGAILGAKIGALGGGLAGAIIGGGLGAL